MAEQMILKVQERAKEMAEQMTLKVQGKALGKMHQGKVLGKVLEKVIAIKASQTTSPLS